MTPSPLVASVVFASQTRVCIRHVVYAFPRARAHSLAAAPLMHVATADGTEWGMNAFRHHHNTNATTRHQQAWGHAHMRIAAHKEQTRGCQAWLFGATSRARAMLTEELTAGSCLGFRNRSGVQGLALGPMSLTLFESCSACRCSCAGGSCCCCCCGGGGGGCCCRRRRSAPRCWFWSSCLCCCLAHSSLPGGCDITSLLPVLAAASHGARTPVSAHMLHSPCFILT